MPPTLDITRREMLRVGSLSALGLSLPQLFAARAFAEQRPARPSGRRRPAKSCILFFMEGGPSHIDTFDLKPQAPVEVRGEFRAIATSVPGVQVCEHLPRLADDMHHVAQVRSVHHTVNDHNAGAYYCLTGDTPAKPGKLIIAPAQGNFPPYGSVLLAGGGICGGAVYDASDPHAAYPADKPVTPEDIAATIYYAMGLDPETEIHDHLGRPHPLARGKPITTLFG